MQSIKNVSETIDKRIISGMPLMSDAYSVGDNIRKTEAVYHDRTGLRFELSNQATACVRFADAIDNGVDAEAAWEDAWAYFEYCEYSEEIS